MASAFNDYSLGLLLFHITDSLRKLAHDLLDRLQSRICLSLDCLLEL